MGRPTILVAESLAATLWNLDEAHAARLDAAQPEVAEALHWLAARRAAGGGYRGLPCAPTPEDYAARTATPTGEDGSLGRAGVAHVLGEESLRALALWGHDVGEPMAWVRDQWGDPGCVQTPGYYCCARCSVARWRALAAGRPPGWEDVLADGLRRLADEPRNAAGRWTRFPLCYTLLALSDVPLPESRAIAETVRPAAERSAKRLRHANTQQARLRLRALAWALG